MTKPTKNYHASLYHFKGKDDFFLKAFISTTMDEMRVFNGNVTFEIRIKDGAIIENISSFKKEREVLLKAGQEFKVLGYEYDEIMGIYNIVLEQI